MKKIFVIFALLLPVSLVAAGITPEQELERAVQSVQVYAVQDAINHGATNVDDLLLAELRRNRKIDDKLIVL